MVATRAQRDRGSPQREGEAEQSGATGGSRGGGSGGVMPPAAISSEDRRGGSRASRESSETERARREVEDSLRGRRMQRRGSTPEGSRPLIRGGGAAGLAARRERNRAHNLEYRRREESERRRREREARREEERRDREVRERLDRRVAERLQEEERERERRERRRREEERSGTPGLMPRSGRSSVGRSRSVERRARGRRDSSRSVRDRFSGGEQDTSLELDREWEDRVGQEVKRRMRDMESKFLDLQEKVEGGSKEGEYSRKGNAHQAEFLKKVMADLGKAVRIMDDVQFARRVPGTLREAVAEGK